MDDILVINNLHILYLRYTQDSVFLCRSFLKLSDNDWNIDLLPPVLCSFPSSRSSIFTVLYLIRDLTCLSLVGTGVEPNSGHSTYNMKSGCIDIYYLNITKFNDSNTIKGFRRFLYIYCRLYTLSNYLFII